MTGHMPKIPPGNQSKKGPTPNADAKRDTSAKEPHLLNTAERAKPPY
jgi:hypothetical protein